ncbi:transferase [Streptomyces thermocarboxydus]
MVVPTLGRPSLGACLQALAESEGPRPVRVVLVDDRRDPAVPLTASVPLPCGPGPSWCTAGRAAGRRPQRRMACRRGRAVDRVPRRRRGAGAHVGRRSRARPRRGERGDRRDHRPRRGATAVDRAPTDWNAMWRAWPKRWITADMAYRRKALEAVGGFDERFRRAFREDADLALRVLDAGWTLAEGAVRPRTRCVPPTGGLRAPGGQRGRRADDPAARAGLVAAGAPRAVSPAPGGDVGRARGGGVRAHRTPARRGGLRLRVARGTAEFALARILPGPRTRTRSSPWPSPARSSRGRRLALAARTGAAPRHARPPPPGRAPVALRGGPVANGCRHEPGPARPGPRRAPAGALRTARPQPRPEPDPRTAVSAPRPRPITEVSP